ncbi:hypothetical protein [Dokdonella sp.]|uniref:hypothetical protein n=1 Tax=Dokdonella sp. TaxID=2291710 RepID=UPI002616FA1B|nr:hypothetical protein [Dokdonella sp.]
MRWGPAGLLLIGIMELSGCALWPWHHRHPEPVADVAEASARAASTPEPATSAPAASAAAPAWTSAEPPPSADPAPAVPEDALRYAPFSASEWRRLWDIYSPLAACTDHYMASAGINGQLLGVTLVQLKKEGQVIAEARQLLGRELPPLADDAPADASAELASRAVWLLMQDQPSLPLGQVLARKALARYDLALVAGPACRLDPEYHSLLAKALR